MSKKTRRNRARRDAKRGPVERKAPMLAAPVVEREPEPAPEPVVPPAPEPEPERAERPRARRLPPIAMLALIAMAGIDPPRRR